LWVLLLGQAVVTLGTLDASSSCCPFWFMLLLKVW
jgi:hypothetical protein